MGIGAVHSVIVRGMVRFFVFFVVLVGIVGGVFAQEEVQFEDVYDASSSKRAAALRQIKLVVGVEDGVWLYSLLGGEEDLEVRILLVEAIAKSGDEGSIQRLVNYLERQVVDGFQYALVQALGSICHVDIDLMLSFRNEALLRLGAIASLRRNQHASKLLLERLRGGAAGEEEILFILEALGEHSQYDGVFEDLLVGSESFDSDVFRVLIGIRSVKSYDLLVRYFDRIDEDLYFQLVSSLKIYPDERLLGLLLSKWESLSLPLKAELVEVLGLVKVEGGVEILLEAAEYSRELKMRRRAIRSLGRYVEEERVQHLLVRFLCGDAPLLVSDAMYALSQLDEGGFDYWLRGLDKIVDEQCISVHFGVASLVGVGDGDLGEELEEKAIVYLRDYGDERAYGGLLYLWSRGIVPKLEVSRLKEAGEDFQILALRVLEDLNKEVFVDISEKLGKSRWEGVEALRVFRFLYKDVLDDSDKALILSLLSEGTRVLKLHLAEIVGVQALLEGEDLLVEMLRKGEDLLIHNALVGLYRMRRSVSRVMIESLKSVKRDVELLKPVFDLVSGQNVPLDFREDMGVIFVRDDYEVPKRRCVYVRGKELGIRCYYADVYGFVRIGAVGWRLLEGL